ncbi:hypothetical protein DFJ74DRAFT_710944 [Hyaloraphidium curvatum]|nr:hypothetical protein DFJ74DRAFT_710944 [Hyaloraphidium curvatum]
MPRLLITGASGQVGSAVLDALASSAPPDVEVLRAGRAAGPGTRVLDFEDASTWPPALEGVSGVFLLRPPHLADVPKIFAPFIRACEDAGVEHVVFLSVQGAENSPRIPHHGIEEALRSSNLKWTFVRPAYFDENLTSQFRNEIRDESSITLPSGRALFNWVDAADVGAMAAYALLHPGESAAKAWIVSGPENLDFSEVCRRLSAVLGRTVSFHNVNPVWYAWRLWRKGTSLSFIQVMLMLHFLPRFFPEPEISDDFLRVLGRAPNPLDRFLEENKGLWMDQRVDH